MLPESSCLDKFETDEAFKIIIIVRAGVMVRVLALAADVNWVGSQYQREVLKIIGIICSEGSSLGEYYVNFRS